MCLNTYDKKAKTADKPIPCYKLVRKIPGGFSSEYQDFLYDIGGEYSMKPGAYFPWSNRDYPAQLSIYCGFHSYARLKDAADICLEYKGINGVNTDDFYGEVILKCEIPKGSLYWEGNKALNDKGYKEYCSNRIKVTGWKFLGETKWHTSIKEEQIRCEHEPAQSDVNQS